MANAANLEGSRSAVGFNGYENVMLNALAVSDKVVNNFGDAFASDHTIRAVSQQLDLVRRFLLKPRFQLRQPRLRLWREPRHVAHCALPQWCAPRRA